MKAITFTAAGAFILFSAFIIKNNSQPSLYDTKWSLKKIYDSTGMTVVNTKAFIKFHGEKKSAGGNGSCNNFGSSIIVKDHSISFSDVFSTKMYCEGVQQIEDAFFKQLAKVNRFDIKNKTLILYCDKEVMLEFVAE